MEARDDGGKPTKIPYQCERAARASSNDPSGWSNFTTALMTYNASSWDGIGFMLAGGDVTCIDLDHCIVDNVIEDWAVAIVAKVGSYTETSQSGEGLHIFVHGKPPAGRRRKGVVEMYGPDDNRYIAVTGHRLAFAGTQPLTSEVAECDLDALHAELFPHDEPTTAKGIESDTKRSTAPIPDAEIFGLALRAANSAKFAPLYNGDWSGYASPSEARMAAVSILAFYTQDVEQLISLCEQLGFDRDDDARKMRNHDIPHALETLTETYTKPTGRIGPISHDDNSDDEIDDEIIVTENRVLEPISFPFDALPASLRTLAKHGGESSGCVPEAVAVHGLSVLGAAIGSTATIQIGSWRQRPVVWTAVVARPGTAKSTALKLAMAPLEAADARCAAATA